MKKCVSCGTENADDAVFCSECRRLFGERTQDREASKSMPETGTSAPEEIREDEDISLASVQPPRLVIPPTPELTLSKDDSSAALSDTLHPQRTDEFSRPTQQFKTVPPQRIMYDPSLDIMSLRELYRRKYPALGISAVILKIVGWLCLVLTPVFLGFVAAFPSVIQSYMHEDLTYFDSGAGVAGGIVIGLILGALTLLSCYTTAALLDFMRDKEREGRIHTDILLRTLNKK